MQNQYLIDARLLRLWTPQKASQKVGVTLRTYQRWEKATHLPTLETLQLLCAAFGENPESPEKLGYRIDRVTGRIRLRPPESISAQATVKLASEKVEQASQTNQPVSPETPTDSPDVSGSPESGESLPPISLKPTKEVFLLETLLWLLVTHHSEFSAFVQRLQQEPQRSNTPLVIESSPDPDDTSSRKEEDSPPSDSPNEDIIGEGGNEMDKGRRNVAIALAGGPLFIPGSGNHDLITEVQRVLRYPSSGPGDQELKYLEQKIRYYWDDHYDVRIVPTDLMLHAAAYVREVKALLDHSLFPTTRMRLCTCLSQGMLLIGTSFHNLGQFQSARVCYQTALESAQEANHTILQALAWHSASYSWIRSNERNRHKHALDSMLNAWSFASLEPDFPVQCFIQAGLAEVYALNNKTKACLEALKNAAKLSGYGLGDWYFIHRFDLAKLNGYRGICLQQFYRRDDPETHPLLEEARRALNEALSLPNGVLERAFKMVDMAQIHAREGEVESACDHAKQIMSIADTSAPLRQRLSVVRIHLEPYIDVQAVKDLDTDIKALLLPKKP